jgi:iron(III) transport system substrate-binding protein
MPSFRSTVSRAGLAAALLIASSPLALATGELNLYSSRHYDTDERLYSDFEEQSGIKINRIEGKADELLTRMEAEGQNSPADILLTVDTSRLERAKGMGLLQSVESPVLEQRLPGLCAGRRQSVVRLLSARAHHLLRQGESC